MHFEQDTICAISTPPGMGGVAVVRVSGAGAVSALLGLARDLEEPLQERHVLLTSLFDEEGLIDEALVTLFRGPRSYTGEDVVELSVHGSTYIQQRCLLALTHAGARMARPGEFTQRAFLNRKMDLSQAEAVADLISSTSKAAHRLAQQQMKGGYSQEIATLRDKLVELASLMELELDFAEEDVEFADRDHLLTLIDAIIARVQELVRSFRAGNAIKHGVPVAIIGAPNSGKSTLLNRLLGEQRAIVSDIPGTTRDAIEDSIQIAGIEFRFIDTAGLRESTDEIESQGIGIAMEKARNARVVLYLYDLSQEDRSDDIAWMKALAAEMHDDQHLIFVANKTDAANEPTNPPKDHLRISALTGEGMNALTNALVNLILADGNMEDIMLTNIRHVNVFRSVLRSLEDVRNGMRDELSTELLAVDLRQAIMFLGEITGEITTEDLLGSIFSRFCIGK